MRGDRVFYKKSEVKRKTIVDSVPKLNALVEKMRGLKEFAFDCETNTLDVRSDNESFILVGVSISWGSFNNYYIPLGHRRLEDLNKNVPLDIFVRKMKPIFENPIIRIIGANILFDMHCMNRVGIRIKTKDLFDVIIASWLCDENTQNSLKSNTVELLEIAQTKFKETVETVPKEVKKEFGLKATSKATFDLVLVEDGWSYAVDDAFYTFMLYLGFMDYLESEGQYDLYMNSYREFIQVIFRMEELGVSVDREKLEKMGEEMQGDLEELEYKIYKLAGIKFNISSTQQKYEILYGYVNPDVEVKKDKLNKKVSNIILQGVEDKLSKEELNKKLEKEGMYFNEKGNLMKKANVNWELIEKSFKFKVQGKTDSGKPSTDKTALINLSRANYTTQRKKDGVEMCKLMLEYSKLSKLKSAFVDGLLSKIDNTNKIHPSFKIHGCVEGSTLIPTSEGMIPIDSLVDSWEDDVKYDCKLKILNKDFELEDTSYTICFKDIEGKRITTDYGISIACSNIHPLWHTPSLKGENLPLMSEGFKNAEDIRTGDYVALPFNYQTFSNSNQEIPIGNTKVKVSKDLALFAGIMVNCGKFYDSYEGKYTEIVLNKLDPVSYNKLPSLIEKVAGTQTIFRVGARARERFVATSLKFKSKKFGRMLQALGLSGDRENIKIPNVILKCKKDVVASFIKGLTVGGYYDKEGFIFRELPNDLVNQIQAILLNFGILSYTTSNMFETERSVRIPIKYLGRFREEIGNIYENIPKDIPVPQDEGVSKVWAKVEKVRNVSLDVYDFNVPSSHSFVSGGFISHNTDSGRLSASSPNLMQLPKAGEEDKYQIRSIFIGSKDEKTGKRKKIIALDFSNLEMRIITLLSQDPNLIHTFKEGLDMHGTTAKNMLDLDCEVSEVKKLYPHERQVGKVLNFLLAYGGGEFTLYENLKNDPFNPIDLGDEEHLSRYGVKKGSDVARIYIDKYFEAYPGVRDLIQSQKDLAHRQEYVTSILGRKRRLVDINNRRDFKAMSYNERLATNFAIQASASDLVIHAQLRIYRDPWFEENGVYMLLQIHDELVLECPEELVEEACKKLQHYMEHPFGDDYEFENVYFNVEYDVGDNYAEAK